MFSRKSPGLSPSSAVTAPDTISAWRKGAHGTPPAMPRGLHAIAAVDCSGASCWCLTKSSVTRKTSSPHAGRCLAPAMRPKRVAALARRGGSALFICQMPTRSDHSVELEHILKKRRHARLGVRGRGEIGRHMRVELDARILVGKRLLGGGVDQQALGLLANAAMADGLAALGNIPRRAAERVVEGVPDVGICGQLDVVAGGAQPRHKGL